MIGGADPVPPALGEPNSSPAGRTVGTPEEPVSADPVAPWLDFKRLEDISPLDYALLVLRDPKADPERRDKMCIALLPYLHQRMADTKPSKKDMKAVAAEKASTSKFAAGAPPKLAAVK